MEGGGDGKDGKAALRQGMNAFLGEAKAAAESLGWRWQLTACGGRDRARRGFLRALENQGAKDVAILLVDAEGSLTREPIDHLQDRDGWDLISASERAVHLMVQTMETWIVADPAALAGFYGQGFRASALSSAVDLEAVPKKDVARDLREATRRTSKGEYHKIRHVRALLETIEPGKVRQRCQSCERLFTDLKDMLGQGR